MKKIFKNIGVKVSLITLVINFLLFVFKLIIGIVANSNALISDAVHSLSDAITTIAVIFGLIISKKPTKNILMVMRELNLYLLLFYLSFYLLQE